MDTLCSAAASACILGIIFAVSENMLPSEKFAKQMKMIFSLILIAVIIAPFTEGEISLDSFEMPDITDKDSTFIYNSSFNSLVSDNISDNLGKELSEMGIFPVKISVDINNSQDNSISIIGAEIIISSGNTRETAEAAAEILGIDRSLISVKTEGTS